jgi:DNA replication licensing factor MCM5
MSGFDANVIHTVPILGERLLNAAGLDNASDTERLLLDFLTQFRVEGQFIYRCVARQHTSRQALKDTRR